MKKIKTFGDPEHVLVVLILFLLGFFVFVAAKVWFKTPLPEVLVSCEYLGENTGIGCA